jgi:hypothetical protein
MQAVGERAQAVAAPRDDPHVATARREAFGEDGADAGGGPGHDRRRSRVVSIHVGRSKAGVHSR